MTARSERTAPGEDLITVSGLSSGYGAVPVVRSVDLTVRTGEVFAVVGGNGAGKTTLLSTLSGLLRPTSGSVRFAGADITGRSPERIVAQGLVHIPEGRRLFTGLTVAEHLRLGLWNAPNRRRVERERTERVVDLFPVLGERMGAYAEVLSGGEQQMLAIGQALMRRPRLLLLDEPSIGLAPVIIQRVFAVVDRLRAENLTVILVEQRVGQALALADRGLVMRHGRVEAAGDAAELARDPALRAAYLGAAGAGGQRIEERHER
ncbi:branched-chain amino acid transport system ATP-binding protein [Actinomadura luteofluorescens]|uniref:Branched-chain amino acid transport system ATP-binding protein n=1 Tax=Actinomadura luteofluorescens TaxID=46163 RepID=A0A7Y9EBL9_9ACTN|nr:ATP-binding cassette domain-containing protein [Actinomadura luteofluorescens]NYD44597.1 branched-chain amino acid transport system ATP-binding protein [Actinomadura luteofluorescens]